MRILRTTTKDKVYSAWLKSELYRMKNNLTPEQVKVIENPNFGDSQENLQREDLILNVFGRSAIINYIPSDITWHEVSIEKADLETLYILAIWDWFIDTGKTFKLSGIPANLSNGHGHRVSNFPPGAADHKSKIDTMAQTMTGNIGDIIMISSTQTGPFTIIDGTHRSSLLAINGNLSGVGAYLGIANDLSQCVWAPEWSGYQDSLTELNQLVDGGHLW